MYTLTYQILTNNINLQPYIFALIGFIITYFLITTPAFPWIVYHSANDTWAKYIIAIIIASFVFIAVAYSMKKDDPIIPQ